jgi:hypothetical protein
VRKILAQGAERDVAVAGDTVSLVSPTKSAPRAAT